MTHRKVRYYDFAGIDAILVCLNHSKNYHTGIYHYFTCIICTDISRQCKFLLPQIICRVTEGFFVFCLVLVLLWFNEAFRRNKQKYEGDKQPRAEAILLQLEGLSARIVWMFESSASYDTTWLSSHAYIMPNHVHFHGNTKECDKPQRSVPK